MAKLEALPSQGIIDGFRGSVDFYYYLGIPVARKWPRSPGKTRTPKVEATAQQFAWVQQSLKSASPAIIQSWKDMHPEAPFTWRDWATRQTLAGASHSHEWQE